MSDRPNLLFLTPILPFTAGTGSAIRAGVALECLSRYFNVFVLHAELYGWHPKSFRMDFVQQRARYVYYVPKVEEIPVLDLITENFPRVQFQAIHTFRLLMARAAIAVTQASAVAPYNVLDLDDDEHNRFERFLAIREEDGESARTRFERAALPRLRMMERMLLPRFQTLCMAAESDCERLHARCGNVPVVHLPNAVFPPAALVPTSKNSRPTLLFIGTLDYLPNADAVDHLVTRILPLLREKLPDVRVLVVGANPTPKILNYRDANVEVLGSVPDVAPYYAECDAVIVPLRAGSGTRIKILEAFGFRKPVVSTSVGAEGLSVADGAQLLLADDPAAFADACLRLLADAALRERLVASARTWLQANHSVDAVDAVLRGIYAKILACPPPV